MQKLLNKLFEKYFIFFILIKSIYRGIMSENTLKKIYLSLLFKKNRSSCKFLIFKKFILAKNKIKYH